MVLCCFAGGSKSSFVQKAIFLGSHSACRCALSCGSSCDSMLFSCFCSRFAVLLELFSTDFNPDLTAFLAEVLWHLRPSLPCCLSVAEARFCRRFALFLLRISDRTLKTFWVLWHPRPSPPCCLGVAEACFCNFCRTSWTLFYGFQTGREGLFGRGLVAVPCCLGVAGARFCCRFALFL